MNHPGKGPGVPQDASKRPPPQYVHPCPICVALAQPGEFLGLYTKDGLRRHKFELHGEVTP